MSTIFWKNLLKCLPTSTTSSNPLNIQQEHTHLLKSPADPTATATARATATATATANTPTTTIMIKNLTSLYDLPSASTSKSLSTPSTYSLSSSDSDSDTDSPPDFAAIFASQRFFFSSPGRSNSIIESPEKLAPPESESEKKLPFTRSVAVKKYSPDPYTDFKNSMQEMIEARDLKDVRADWDYLYELLSCYLTLNPKHIHKFIISAFADLIICILSSSSSSSTESEILQTPESRRRQHNVPHWLV